MSTGIICLDESIRFNMDALNATIPNADAWKSKLQTAEHQRTAALTGKSTSVSGQVRATHELIEDLAVNEGGGSKEGGEQAPEGQPG